MIHGIINRVDSGYFRYQAWPTVAKDKRGKLYVAYSGNRLAHVCPFGKNLLVTSDDEGKSWSAPQIINDTKLDDRDAGLLCWGEESMLLSWFNNTEEVYTRPERLARWPNLAMPLSRAMIEMWKAVPAKEFGSFTKVSHDNGKTWSDPRKCPVTAPHGPIRRKDGSFFYVGTERLSDLSVPKEAVLAVESHDEGESWSLVSILPVPAQYEGRKIFSVCEPHCVDFGDGEILAAIRCLIADNENGTADPRNMTMFTCRSYDSGKTWSEPVFFDDRFGAPPHFLLHSSGALILSCGKRVRPFGQHVRISFDRGNTWQEDRLIGPESASPDLGYPSTVELFGGDLFTVYYQRVASDNYTSILFTRWNLDELK